MTLGHISILKYGKKYLYPNFSINNLPTLHEGLFVYQFGGYIDFRPFSCSLDKSFYNSQAQNQINQNGRTNIWVAIR